MNEKQRNEIVQMLAKIDQAQGFALGQIQALETALGACLLALRGQSEFLSVVRSTLEARVALVQREERSLAVRDGVESTTRALLRYMGDDQPGSVHKAPGERLN